MIPSTNQAFDLLNVILTFFYLHNFHRFSSHPLMPGAVSTRILSWILRSLDAQVPYIKWQYYSPPFVFPGSTPQVLRNWSTVD